MCNCLRGRGAVYLVLDKAIGNLSISAPVEIKRGEALRCEMKLPDSSGKPLAAIAPIKVTVLDSQGHVVEGSGHYGMADGVLLLTFDIASNDKAGSWSITVQEGLTGQSVTHTFIVKA